MSSWERFRKSGRRSTTQKIMLGLAACALVTCALAQTPPGPSRIQDKKGRLQPAPVSTGTEGASTQPAAAPVDTSLAPAAPELAPAHPPVVSWDGSLLTIDADNSSLLDILVAVREKTGASMEFPPSAANERVALHIGPAPARDVLSSLLYGTNFDYIIEADTNDGGALKSLVVTSRGKPDDVVTASATTESDASGTSTSGAHTSKVRMMRGWAAPGKPAFQANAESALAAEQAAADNATNSPAGDAPTSADATPAALDSPPATDASAAQAASTDASSTPAASSDSGSGALASGDAPSVPTRTNVSVSSLSSSVSAPGDQSGSSHMVDDLTRMYQQRRQIQMQQNQGLGQPTN